jgi:hypothetical protein
MDDIEEVKSDINVLINELEETNELLIELPELNMRINIDNEDDIIKLNIYTDNYNFHNTSDCSPNYTKIEESFYRKGNLFECLNYLNHLFKDDGTIRYSRLTDKVYDTEESLKGSEILEKAKLTITKQKEIFLCSVCKELNRVFTSCGHNLCRYCYLKIYKNTNCCEDHCTHVLCPICREKISS